MASPADGFDGLAAGWDASSFRARRAEAVADLIREAAGSFEGAELLDFGCGTGLLGFLFVGEASRVTFADTSRGMLARVEEKASGSRGVRIVDLSSDPLPSGFDAAVSLMALHHIDDYRGAVRDLASALKPGGVLCLCDLDEEDGSFHGGEAVPHKGFRREDIEAAYRDCGLGSIVVRTAHRNPKGGTGREYPLFLAVGRKPGP